MRVNVYSEELTHEIVVINRISISAGGESFHGLRVYTKSHPDLHHTEDDDDRGAVTFWFASMTELNDFREALYTKSSERR